MRETKEQKMARLERQKAEREEENKQLRKENKRLERMLNAVRPKQNENVITTNEKNEIEELRKQITILTNEKEIELKKAQNTIQFLKRRIANLSNQIDGFEKNESKIKQKAALYITKRIEEISNRHYFTEKETENLSRFNEGEITCSEHMPFFDPAHFLIRIHPKNGRDLEWIDYVNIQSHFAHNYEYILAKDKYKAFMEENPNLSTEEYWEFIYKIGKGLLPLYEQYIY